ncbi:uncharacterized protein [Aquarana catesbeiana]|uniref:uncharacterized protein isoform X2 n=1 Tax=Aquarana catesbeiana TaxID=8400 RepID=UPI003CC94B1A
MNKIFIVLILSAMVTTGHLKITCKMCSSLDSTKCSTEVDTECDGPKCMTVSESIKNNNVIYKSVKKTCATDILCDNCFSVSTNHGFKLRVSGECREGDNSNAELEYKEQCRDKMPLNNFMCPSCYETTSADGCKSNGMVLCRGNEFECLKYRSLVQLPDGKEVPVSMQGCITEGGCKMGEEFVFGAKQVKETERTCTPAIQVIPTRKIQPKKLLGLDFL